MDVISGSWPGELFFFKRQTDGSFGASQKVNDCDGKPIDVGSASAVYAADWDNDGDLDLLVGNIHGEVHLVANEGTAAQPSFVASTQLEADGKLIKVPHGDAGPAVLDWDADGKADLVAGCGDGSVCWFRNIGTREEPVLAAGKTLIPAGNSRSDSTAEQESPCGTRAKICVTDYNGDGRLDILLGDFSMRAVDQPELTDEQNEAKVEAQKKWTEILAKYRNISRVAKDETPDQRKERREKLQAVQAELVAAQREVTRFRPMRYEFHGFVWLFLRNDSPEVSAKTIEEAF